MEQLLTSIMVLFAIHSYSSEIKYPSRDIPESLITDAQIVVRAYDVKLKVESMEDASYTVYKVITVMNKNGKSDAELHLPYNKFTKIKNIEASVYDKAGERLKKIRQDDIKDYSAISGYSVFEDNRIKYIDPGEFEYPYTVEYSYQVVYKEVIGFPDWTPIESYYSSVQSSSYTAQIDSSVSFRFNESNIPQHVQTKLEENDSIFYWEVENLPVIRPEEYSLPEMKLIPWVATSPESFEIDGYSGNFSSWNEFGKWVYSLNTNRQTLSEATQQKIQSLVKNATSDKEKVKILYQYMQNNTRYVSIQIGIGSWQPMLADDVDRLAYGDCKALSNYMLSLLKAVGIESIYTLVNAGASALPLNEDFTSLQFNHAILCVPFQPDTLWLECTSQFNPMGYLGTFTDDRKVLLIKPEGGEIVRTKSYNSKNNLKLTHANVKLDQVENSSALIQTNYNGIFFNEMVDLLQSDNKDQQRMMHEKLDLPGFHIVDFSHEVVKSEIPLVSERMNLELKNFCMLYGNRIIFTPNLLSKNSDKLSDKDPRNSDILIERAYSTVDSISYQIPTGFQLANVPEDVLINSEFGTYHVHFRYQNNELLYVRKEVINKGQYDKGRFPDFVKFNNAILKADNLKVALTKM